MAKIVSDIIWSGSQGSSVYTRHHQMRHAVTTEPPIHTSPPLAFATASIVATAPDQLVVTFTPALAAGEQLAVWMTLPDDPGRDPNFNQARLVGFSAPADASPATITSRITAIAGQLANVYLAKTDAFGRTSPKIRVRVTFL